MVRLHLKRLLVVVSVISCTCFFHFYVDNFYHNPVEDNIKSSEKENISIPKFYFETELSYKLRLRVQDRMQFGSKIKALAEAYFNPREGYNESHLDSLPLIRDNIPDMSPPLCKNLTYPASKSKVSVVICYHNELLSLVLRSVYSVILSIPPHNFHEMILIDDGSDPKQFFDLEDIKSIIDSFTVTVRYFRFAENKGFIYSRRYGCQFATGDAILVLDSHVEVKPGFIEPLLAITDKSYNSIASPIIQFWENFNSSKIWAPFYVDFLAFDPHLNWIFHPAPRVHTPFPAAAILGGAFLATKRFLDEVDYFGRGMEGWGGENVEISLKTWMCGGDVLYVPCSQIFHHNAKRSPMNHGDRKKASFFYHNAALVIKSFFSEEAFRDFALHVEIDRNLEEYNFAKYENIVQANKEMIVRNNCTRDFAWIRRTVMPKVESYDADTLIAHTLKVDEQCVDVKMFNRTYWETSLTECQEPKSMYHRVRLTIWNELRVEGRICLDWGYPQLHFQECHGGSGNQKTVFDTNSSRLWNPSTGKCLVIYENSSILEIELCPSDSSTAKYFVPKFHFGVFYEG